MIYLSLEQIIELHDALSGEYFMFLEGIGA